jgi:O-acetyl-ADP-ribose deacetylase (regulator of RNase III)
MKLNLIDINPEMCEAWDSAFKLNDDVTIKIGDFFSLETDAVVSPANSFGFMDGGLDHHISTKLGWHVQHELQRIIKHVYDGELLVGQAAVVSTAIDGFKKPKVSYVISAPTMRVPMILGSNTVNVYLATKAALRAALKHNALVQTYDINTITFSGMGTGVGRVPFHLCAHQMKIAYEEVINNNGNFPITWDNAQKNHKIIMGDMSNHDLQKLK